MRRGRDVGQKEALIAAGILLDLVADCAQRLLLAQPPGHALGLALAGHRVRIIQLIDPAVLEEIAEARVIKEGRVKQRRGVAVVMEHLEKALHVDPLHGEHIKIPHRIKPREGGKLRLD